MKGRRWLTVALAAAAVSAPLAAQQVPLLDHFTLVVGGTWLEADTKARLDSELLGVGTTIDFEDDLGFDSGEFVPSILFEVQLAKRHRLSASWNALNRDSTVVIETEIQFGDRVFPVSTELRSEFDIDDYRAGYTYWPVVADRSAFGVGLGVRVLDLSATLRSTSLNLVEDGSVSGPLPYLDLEYRHSLGSRGRFLAQAGVFAVEIDEISGEQYLGRIAFEHLTFEHLGFGVAASLSQVDADVTKRAYQGAYDLDLNEASVYARLRW